MVIALPILRPFKHEKECETKTCHQDTIKRNILPKFPQQTTFDTPFMEIAKHASSSGEILQEKCVFQKHASTLDVAMVTKGGGGG